MGVLISTMIKSTKQKPLTFVFAWAKVRGYEDTFLQGLLRKDGRRYACFKDFSIRTLNKASLFFLATRFLFSFACSFV